jgi:N,N-dimethylformamidase beta subunit-like protein
MMINTSFRFAIVIFVLSTLMYQIVLTSTFGQQTNSGPDFASTVSILQTPKFSESERSEAKTDSIRPSINITYPAYPATLSTGKLIIEGTASDQSSGIHNVSAIAHTFPFSGNFSVPLESQPIPVSPRNWSHWYLPFTLNSTGTYRVVITAVDNAGNVNYAETTINTPISENRSTHNESLTKNDTSPKIAFVRPTFTEAAYQEHGFYNFYFKYGFPPLGKNITSDLDMLTVKTPRSVSEFANGTDLRNLSNITSLIPINGTELRDVSQNSYPNPQKFWLPFIDNVKKIARNATVTVMRDEDVHDGHIFSTDNKTNAYDILLLFHNEYVTQQEYDNLKQFVKNGGTIVFIDANALYAEVRYDLQNHTITLVKGHDWQFDGKSAKKSVPERWYNETKEWVGGNYLLDYIKNKVTFSHNPFNYTHFEEQYVNNPNTKELIDYEIKYTPSAYFKDPSLWTKIVASYVLEYGKGKVIMLGLTGRNLADNQDFMKFFRNAVLPNALCPKYQSCILEKPENDYTPPSLNMTHPAYPPTVTTGKITIDGVVSDLNSGVANVSAKVGTFPFDDKNAINLESIPLQVLNKKSDLWSIHLLINDTGTYRVVVEARDNAGNVNHAETTINAAIPETNYTLAKKDVAPKIAFVRPTFTEAAYQQHGFFDFYLKHGFPPIGKNITTDLDMLTVKTPKSISEFSGNDPKHLSTITSLIPINGTELHDASQNYFPNPQRFWIPFIEHVKRGIPNSTVTVMRDEDVHDGHIFNSNNNGTNAYDALMLFHDEYVTQKEYDNLRQFVKNGGTVIFVDSNVFRAEVNFDRGNHTITLVKGHDWKFDGKTAKRSVTERWYDETKQWLGSNFLNIDTNITFRDNPFNYTHSEEQFVNNPNTKIIRDYAITFPNDFIQLYLKKEKQPPELQREDIPIEKIKVATYSLNSGDGKVIMLGITGQQLAENHEFMDFFDNTILPNAICPSMQNCMH